MNPVTKQGVRLLGVVAVALAVMCLGLVLGHGGGPGAAHAVVRWTARTSLVLFVLAYVARPLVQLRPTRTARDILSYRKWIGLGFATSHGFHLLGIIAIAWPAPGAFIRSQNVAIIVAVVTYVLLGAMTVTSNERIRKQMRPRVWKRLHRTGMHFAWLAFTATYAAAIGTSPAYVVPTGLLLAIAAIRSAAYLRGKRHQKHALTVNPAA